MSDFRKPRADNPILPATALYRRAGSKKVFKRPKGRRGRKPKGRRSAPYVKYQDPNYLVRKAEDEARKARELAAREQQQREDFRQLQVQEIRDRRVDRRREEAARQDNLQIQRDRLRLEAAGQREDLRLRGEEHQLRLADVGFRHEMAILEQGETAEFRNAQIAQHQQGIEDKERRDARRLDAQRAEGDRRHATERERIASQEQEGQRAEERFLADREDRRIRDEERRAEQADRDSRNAAENQRIFDALQQQYEAGERRQGEFQEFAKQQFQLLTDRGHRPDESLFVGGGGGGGSPFGGGGSGLREAQPEPAQEHQRQEEDVDLPRSPPPERERSVVRGYGQADPSEHEVQPMVMRGTPSQTERSGVFADEEDVSRHLSGQRRQPPRRARAPIGGETTTEPVGVRARPPAVPEGAQPERALGFDLTPRGRAAGAMSPREQEAEARHLARQPQGGGESEAVRRARIALSIAQGQVHRPDFDPSGGRMGWNPQEGLPRTTTRVEERAATPRDR